jgi:hypothetical protein
VVFSPKVETLMAQAGCYDGERKMKRTIPSLLGLAVLAVGLAGTASPVLAQTQSNAVPLREGNIWGGVAHDPRPGVVDPEERAAGVAPSAQQNDAINAKINHLYGKLLDKPLKSHGNGGTP